MMGLATDQTLTEDRIMTALRQFVLRYVDCPVIRAQGNRAAMPDSDFIAMTPLTQLPLSTNVRRYRDDDERSDATVTRATEWVAQIDCYGKASGNRAALLAMLLRDAEACDFFKTVDTNLQPLFASDARQTPLINGEQQYEQRWTFEAHFQINPAATLPQDFARALSVGLINVDVSYPPGAQA